MAITEYKIKEIEFEERHVAGLPDKPSEAGLNAEQLKNRFDANVKQIILPKFNDLIDLLVSIDGAINIGATQINGLSGITVQRILESLKALTDTKKDEEEYNREIALKFDKTEAQELVKSISFNESTGIFTITKYNGSVVNIDTAIEKVALNVRLDTDTQELVLTLIDGTEQRADLSAFLKQNEHADSSTIALSDENNVLVARIKANSILMEHLNSEVTAFIEAREQSAKESAEAASVSEANAKNYMETACNCTTNAGNSETNAKVSESNALVSERNSKASEINAKESENNAKASELAVRDSEEKCSAYELNTYNYAVSASNSKVSAAESAESASIDAERAVNAADSIDTAVIEAKIETKGDSLWFDTETNLLYLTSNGEVIGEGVQVATGTGGGGGGGTTSVVKLVNETGSASITTAVGNEVVLKFRFTSTDDDVPTGDGTCQITVNGAVKATMNISQGSHSVDVTNWLSAGANTVRVRVTDIYGSYKLLSYTISIVDLSIKSTFDATVAYTGDIQFKYVPYGAVAKTVYFILDGKELDTFVTSSTGKQFTKVIPDQTHGVHTLEVYALATVEGTDIESNHLKYDIICTDEDILTPMIASVYDRTEVAQGEQVAIPYIVYDPQALNCDVVLTVSVNGEEYSTKTLNVGRAEQIWNTRQYPMADAVTFSISYTYLDAYSGEEETITKSHTIKVTESDMDVEAETNDLELYLTATGRSNSESNPAVWTNNGVTTTFSDMNWVSTGWLPDANGDTVLRLNGDATAEISFKPFKDDLRVYGKTFEIEFAIRDVNTRNAVVIECMSGGIGIQATADRATLKSEQSEIFCNYRDEERIRLTFVVEAKNEYRMMMIYLNGVLSAVKQYPEEDNFQQYTPVNIKIGSPYCAVDVYNIRSYSNALTFTEVTNNFIADLSDLTEKYERFDNNDIYDEYNNLSYEELRKRISVMTVVGTLPQSKGDKKTVQITYDCLFNPDLSFTDRAEIDVQGTSSQWYVRKNWKIKCDNMHQHDINMIPTKVFCMKADYAESTSTHNTQNANLAHTLYSEKTPAQLVDPRCRSTIYGYPVVMFHQADASSPLEFIGKYNFNFDKGSEEAFGFTPVFDVESWEFKNNTSDACNFTGAFPVIWTEDFEARYPDGGTNVDRLKALHNWVVSTIGNVDKFKAEFEQHFDLHYCLIYYVYTFVALMVDQRAKNMFLTYWADTGKWQPWLYDNDTCFGINNEGELVFDYYHEDTDVVNNENVYNGQNSTLWNNFRLAFPDEIKETYQRLRNDGLLTYDKFVEYFITNGSDQWSESVYNEDADYKYISMLRSKNDASNLYQVRGTGEEHFKYFIENRLMYCDSKWYASDYADDYIALRIYTPTEWAGIEPNADITVTPFSNMYAGVRYKANGTLMQERATAGVAVTFDAPAGEDFSDTESAIYGASQISDVGDLAPLYCGTLNVSKATKLVNLKIGDSTKGYQNTHLTSLSVGTNNLLKTINVENCVNLTDPLGLSGCPNIEEVYAKGSGITGVELANGGLLRIMELPATITALTLMNQKYIESITFEGYSNIKTLRIERSNVDGLALMDLCPNLERVRFSGVNWSYDDASSLLALAERGLKGIDENGVNTDTMWIDGKCHITNLTGSEAAQLKELYPYLTITYTNLSAYLIFMNADGTKELTRQLIAQGGNGTDPVANGSISAPTKASDAQYHYTYAGWALTVGGQAAATALLRVTADRRVYPAFTTELRTYNVYFYNEDTLLQVKEVAYGDTGYYTGSPLTKPNVPNTADYEFTGWHPSPVGITGETKCYAQYQYIGIKTVALIERSYGGVYENDTVTTIGQYAFSQNMDLTGAKFTKAITIDDYAFELCTALSKADFAVATSIGKYAFSTCTALNTLILRNSTMCALEDIDAFRSTGIERGTGYVYVPSALVETYLADTKWGYYANRIRSIEDYPDICG